MSFLKTAVAAVVAAAATKVRILGLSFLPEKGTLPQMKPFVCGFCALLLSFTHSTAETVRDREGAVRGDRAAMENDARWIYNDVQRGFEEAQKTGKPLLVVLRCVPCVSCMGIDASVLQDPGLTTLLDQFVCVRLINANAIDLSLFQFDYDLSFSTLFFNGDGTVYGRYGSWRHQKDPQDKTTQGYQRALEGALALHQDYPANKASLTGKRGGPTPFKTPVEIPSLAEKYGRELDWQGKVVQSCVHCHMVGDAFRAAYHDRGDPVPEQWIYPQPAPETAGITLAADAAARVEAVAPGSPAASAGIAAGDEILSLDGQPLISIADFSWVLHRAPDPATLNATIRRSGGAEVTVKLALAPGWRSHTDISKRVGTWGMRGMACGGLVLEDLSDDDRTSRGLDIKKMALWVKGLGQFGKHGAAKKAGFQKEDVVIALGGLSQRMTESELIGYLLQNYRVGDQIKATVLRMGKEVSLVLPIQ